MPDLFFVFFINSFCFECNKIPLFGFLCLMSHVVLQYINLLCKCSFCNHVIDCNGTSVCAHIALQLISNKLIREDLSVALACVSLFVFMLTYVFVYGFYHVSESLLLVVSLTSTCPGTVDESSDVMLIFVVPDI